MYEVSRDLFRSLRPGLLPDARHPGRPARELLSLCEEAVTLIAMNPANAKLQAQRLFNHSRFLYPVSRYLELLDAVEHHVDQIAKELRADAIDGRRSLLRCVATTRRDKPCLREPLIGLRYCPSHKHLDETPESVGRLGRTAVMSR